MQTPSFTLQFRRACSFVLLPNLSNLLARAHSLLSFACWPSLFGRASHKSVGLLPRALSFTHRKFAELSRSCFLQICRACSPMQTPSFTLQFRRACSFVLLPNLSNLLARAHSLLSFACWPSLFGRASHKSVGLLPRALSFTHRKFAELSRSCFLQICRACSPMQTPSFTLQFRRACSFVLLPNLSNLLARAHSLLSFACWPSLFGRASHKSVGLLPRALSFTHRKFAELSRSCFLQICRACSPMQTPSFTLQFRRACSFVLLPNLSNLLARAHSLLSFACWPSLFGRASHKSVGLLPRALSFTHRKFAELSRSCFLQICRACSPMQTPSFTLQFRRACSFVLLPNLSNLLARAHSLLSFACWPSLFGRASHKSVGLLPRALSFTHRKFAELSRSCFLQICRACSPMQTPSFTLQFRRACSFVLLPNLSNLLARAHSLLSFACWPSLFGRASHKSVGLLPRALSFTHRKFAELSRSCFLQICRACSPMQTPSFTLQFRRACSFVLLPNLSNLLARAHSLLSFASSPSLLIRASCISVGPARPCTLSFTPCNFAEPTRSCFFQICRTCSLVHTIF
ncbi:hypothetical protein CRG98_019943 [Punica granatum]|uniref:Uncharacterized protein n=1 Tax=Punica granatum TaxID=22663 RepID=A0A2I0JTN7_PUNGR|nr:hypothetical protein CRG98_019943 [Punica granatum]